MARDEKTHLIEMSSPDPPDEGGLSQSALNDKGVFFGGNQSRENSLPLPVMSPAKRKRGCTAHDTWGHARKPRPSEPERDGKRTRYWYCRYCENPTYKALCTTSARRHLERVHGIRIEAAESAIKKSSAIHIRQIFEKQAVQAQQAQNKHDHDVFKSVLHKNAISEALARLITMRNLSDRCVEWPELHALLRLVNPAIGSEVTCSHSEVTKIIAKTYEQHKNVLREKLSLAKSRIHLSVDGWSSPNRANFLAVCAHFVDENFHLRKALLALPELRDGKGAETQFKVIVPVLEDYGIASRVGYLTGDNHGSNDKLCRHLRDFLRDRFNVEWDAVQHRIRCQGHVINLAVQAFLLGKNTVAIDDAVRQVEDGEEIGVSDLVGLD
ncbi:hypothetical protein HIM_12571 [Hirsutella minnesotensis 3608]|uniref:BED-type domain-containing protein n=1 Tax=Hirsutella minnesotensis 3608 TaxID=1043627 RepID=A0A0F7ZQK8_9HYPO|nr:hypothetical protein HIM_12571 [Hirsutella minnesotensis 3608]